MAVTDPRERYDALHETESRDVVPADEFAATADSEPASVGLCAFVFAVDPADRVLFIRQDWADGWLAPGGARQPGESLRETARRELREETGVDATVVRPHAVDELTVEHAETGATTGWTSVFYEAHTDDPTVDRDPTVDDETIEAAEWFDDLPGELFTPDHTERLWQRVRESE